MPKPARPKDVLPVNKEAFQILILKFLEFFWTELFSRSPEWFIRTIITIFGCKKYFIRLSDNLFFHLFIDVVLRNVYYHLSSKFRRRKNDVTIVVIFSILMLVFRYTKDLGNDLFFAIFLLDSRLLEEKCLVFRNECIKGISLMIYLKF